MIGGIGQLQLTLQQRGPYIDEAIEALALIESGAVASTTLEANLRDHIVHYQAELTRRR
jgi:hypothetical protein